MFSQSNILTRIIKLGLYLVLLTPLIAWDQVIYPFVFPKIVFFRIIIEIALFFYIILCLKDRSFAPKATALTLALGVYMGIIVITSLWGADSYQSFFSTLARGEGVFTLLHLFAFFIIASSIFRSKNEWTVLLLFFFAMFSIENILAFAQTLHIPYVKMFGATRPNGSFGNPAYFASYNALGLWISYYLYTVYKKNPWRLVFPVAIALGMINIYYAINRASTLGIFMGVIAYIVLEVIYNKNELIRKKYFKFFLWLLCILALASFINPGTSIIKKLTRYNGEDPSIKNRLISWDIGLKGFRERPLLGWGNENYSYVFNKYFNPKIITGSEAYSWFDRVHNTVIEILVANGAFGVMAYLSIFIIAFMGIQKSTMDRREKNICISFFVCYFFINFFIFDTISTLILFFILLAMIQSGSYERSGVFRRLLNSFHREEKISAHPLIIGSISIIIISSVYIYNIKPIRATYYASRHMLAQGQSYGDIYDNFTKAFALSTAHNFEIREILGNYIINKIINGESPKNLERLLMLAMDNLKDTAKSAPNNIQVRLTYSELARITSEINPFYIKIAEEESLFIIKSSPMRYQPYF